MTREEAKEWKIIDATTGIIYSSEKLIDEIYDEFESELKERDIFLDKMNEEMISLRKELQERDSRTCESCKHLKERNPFNKPVFPRHACSHADVIYMCTDKDFSCNKWSKKDD